MPHLRTQVAIVGAGPAGLILAQLLHCEGIDSIVIETQSRHYVEARIRAGVLEQNTVDLLRQAGVGERMDREGLLHHGIELRFNGQGHRIDFQDLTSRAVCVYGQHEILKDLIAARHAAAQPVFFEASQVQLHECASDTPRVIFHHSGESYEVACDFIGGCDGFHGVCRESIPEGVLSIYEKAYPFGWLGILAEAAPVSPELIYANHPRGFALLSMRSSTITRAYLQCKSDENLAEWSDARIWDELHCRTGQRLNEGPLLQKGVIPMRSFVVEPMQHGRLYLAGDAAHIVPPTGAKGMNLAAADVRVLADALAAWYRHGTSALLQRYSEICLRRVWRVQHFSWWMTSLLHRFDGSDGFEQRRQIAELEQVVRSRAAATMFAENYTGLPLERAG